MRMEQAILNTLDRSCAHLCRVIKVVARERTWAMPELHTIQTFQRLSGNLFGAELQKACDVFSSLDLLTSEVRRMIDVFSWEQSEDGFVYASDQIWVNYKGSEGNIDVNHF